LLTRWWSVDSQLTRQLTRCSQSSWLANSLQSAGSMDSQSNLTVGLLTRLN